MAGLVASAVAARHFEQVTMLDKETLPSAPHPRKAVPQGNHVHALLKSGELFLSELFPNFREEALSSGCLEFKVRSQWRTYGPNGWIEPVDIGLTALSQSQPLIEHVVRKLVSRLQNVSVLSGCVDDLQRVGDTIGVILVNGTRINANLVVDASGRGGGTTKWLASLGGSNVPCEEYRPEIRYASTFFSRSINKGPNYGGWLMFTPAPETKGAVALPVENDRWLVTAYTRFGEAMPRVEKEFRDFLRDLPDSKISNLISDEIAQARISNYAIDTVRFRRFDKIADAMPEGYIPLGDTIATFSPINAQGISVAALQAKELHEALATHKGEDSWRSIVSRNYIKKSAIPAEWAWDLCQALDAGFENLRGTISASAHDLSQTIRQVAENAGKHPELVGAMGRAIHLLESPRTFVQQVRNTLDA